MPTRAERTSTRCTRSHVSSRAGGCVGAVLGLALHREDRGSDPALGHQGMVGFGYERTREITATAGLRGFGA